MKRCHEVMACDRPRALPELKTWLRRVQLFEEVNWETPLPDHSALKELAAGRTEWDWTPACNEAYYDVVAHTGILHAQGLLHFAESPGCSTLAGSSCDARADLAFVDSPESVRDDTATDH